MGNCCNSLLDFCCGELPDKRININITNPCSNINTLNCIIQDNTGLRKNDTEKQPLIKNDEKSRSSKMERNNDSTKSDREIASESQDLKKQVSSKSGLKHLKLKDFQFYNEKIGMSTSVFLKSSDVYKEQGQYDFDGETYIDEIYEKIGEKDGSKYYYVGQFKKNSKVEDGIGICVWNSGDIYEGYNKDGAPNGKGRYIYSDGSYYTGEWKDGKRNGQGESHSDDGQMYRGMWKDDKRNGQGTLTHSDGTKETGKWKNDKYLGKNAS